LADLAIAADLLREEPHIRAIAQLPEATRGVVVDVVAALERVELAREVGGALDRERGEES
jgi:hypothetical protein